jgi:hypothetical protein
MSWTRCIAVLVIAGAIGACSGATGDGATPSKVISGGDQHQIASAPDQSFAILLGNVGPGQFGDPEISAPGLTFTGFQPVQGVRSPAGITQQYGFTASAAGRYIVTFRQHDGIDPAHPRVVVDTVVVRP